LRAWLYFYTKAKNSTEMYIPTIKRHRKIMKRIREGNDFDVTWAIKRAGVPEDFSTAIEKRLTMVVYGNVIEHSLYTITDNILAINVPKEVAHFMGDYRLVFEYTLPDLGQPDGDLKCKTDVVASGLFRLRRMLTLT